MLYQGSRYPHKLNRRLRMRKYVQFGICLCFCLFVVLYEVQPRSRSTGSHFGRHDAFFKSALINRNASLVNIDAFRKTMPDLTRETAKSFEEYDGFETADAANVSVFENLPMTDHVSKPACTSLIRGDKQAVERSLIFTGLHPYRRNIDYISETRNCRNFLERRGYITDVTKEEAEFPLAFSIVMYKDVEQVERLIRAIYRPSNHYCVHVDRNADFNVREEMKGIVKCLPNVFMASRNIHVKWGQFSVLETELICMKDLLKMHGWKYFINLTGQEFPLKTNLQIVNILKILKGTNSVDADRRQKWMKRWSRVWPPPNGITPYKGCVHVIVSRDFVEFVINDVRAKNFTEWLKKTTIPDETFFATLDNNQQLFIPGTCTGQVATDYKDKPFIARFKNFGQPSGLSSFTWACNGKRVRQVCIWGVGDLPLLTSRRELFTNKFHINFEPQTFDCIEEWHRNMTEMEHLGKYKLDYRFYRNMPQLRSLKQRRNI